LYLVSSTCDPIDQHAS